MHVMHPYPAISNPKELNDSMSLDFFRYSDTTSDPGDIDALMYFLTLN